MYMPKPDVIALTGGHRRTPFMQVGADIYCDTALISDVLEQMTPMPTLYPEAVKGAARIVAQWADTSVFPVAMAYNFQPSGAAHVLAGWNPEDIKVFVQDRATMRGGAPRMPPADAEGMYRSYLRRLANMLDHHPFLMGDAPSIADFSAYHSTWYTLRKVAPLAGIFDATPNVRSWIERMEKFGHGTHVSGTIAAIGNNSLGVIGVAPKAKIMPLKGLDDTGHGSISALANAIVYAAEHGAKVINNSWGCGGYCPSQPVAEDAVRFAEDMGAVVVFAAGNENVEIGRAHV